MTIRASALLAVVLVGGVLGAGCSAPSGAFSPEDAATAVAATVAAMSASVVTDAPSPTLEEHTLPTESPTAAAPN
jgi:hypothetical protein